MSSTKREPSPPPDDGFRTRPRRRGATLERAILDAAWAELTEVAYRDFTVERVAARAQTGKQAVYRRWPGRAQLAIAALRTHSPGLAADDAPDTGELRGDVLALLRRTADRFVVLGPEGIHGLLAEVVDAGDRELLTGGRAAGETAMYAILKRAAARGEVALERITPRVATLPVDLLRQQLFVAGTSVSDAAVREIVDEVFLPLVGRR